MIDVLMLYCLSVAALVSVAAFAGERVVAALGLPRRTVWIGALSISLCLPLLMIATSDPSATPTIATPVAAIEVATIVDSAPAAEMPLDLPSVATMLQGLWILGSGGLLVFVIVGWIRLRVAARKWTSEQVEGVEVQVADNLGPAVFGFFNPKIIVPRWLLDAPAADRSAAIAHERSHIAAGDTLLLLLGLLLVVITPWNLPMWWQLRRLRFAIEVDCDQRVLRGGTSMDSYGEMLLAVGQRNSRTPIGAMALTEPASQLERRIRIMTKGTIQPIKALMLVFLAMSVSLVAVAAQLDAPSITAIAPSLLASRAAYSDSPQVEIPQPELLVSNASVKPASSIPVVAKITTPSPAIDQKTAIDPATSNHAERGRLVTERLAQAKSKLPAVVAPTDWVTTKGAKGEFVYSADRAEARGSFQLLHNVVAKRRVDDTVEVFEAQRAELHGTDQELQSLILYEGKHYFEGQGNDDSYKEFERLVLPVSKPRAAAATSPATNVDSGAGVSSTATINPPAINPASINRPVKRKSPFIPPVTPEWIAQDGVIRWVEVAFTVTVEGTVQDAEVYKSQPDGKLDEAALTAVRQWLFEPAIKDGKAVATRTMIRMRFDQPSNRNPNATARPSGDAAGTNASTYKGERLTLNFKDIDVRTVLKLLADTSGQNILVSDKVSGKITLQLSNVPWDEALDLIVKEKGLVKRQQGSILFIEPGTTQTQL